MEGSQLGCGGSAGACSGDGGTLWCRLQPTFRGCAGVRRHAQAVAVLRKIAETQDADRAAGVWDGLWQRPVVVMADHDKQVRAGCGHAPSVPGAQVLLCLALHWPGSLLVVS